MKLKSLSDLCAALPINIKSPFLFIRIKETMKKLDMRKNTKPHRCNVFYLLSSYENHNCFYSGIFFSVSFKFCFDSFCSLILIWLIKYWGKYFFYNFFQEEI
jgi:hypothetical protein